MEKESKENQNQPPKEVVPKEKEESKKDSFLSTI
jgi:hypothetical protein